MVEHFNEQGSPGAVAKNPEARGGGLGTCRAILKTVSDCFLAAARLLLVAMLVLILVEIGLRNIAGISTQISDEYSGYFACWATLLGFLHVARNDEFIRVEFLLVRLKGRGREGILLLGSLCALLVAMVVCYATFNLAWNSYRFHSISQAYSATPMFIPQAVLPASYFFLCVIFLDDVVTRAGRLFRSRDGARPA